MITIIGLLAAIGLPAIRGMTKSNSMAAANRQLLDDLALRACARSRPSDTTVYMVYLPPAGFDPNWHTLTKILRLMPNLSPNEQVVASKPGGAQYTTYAVVSG